MFVSIGRRFAAFGDVGPAGGECVVELQPFFQAVFCIGQDRFGGAFGFTDAAIDAFAWVDDEHIFALIEAIDRADLHTVHIFALDAGFGHDIGHLGAPLKIDDWWLESPFVRVNRDDAFTKRIMCLRLCRWPAPGGERCDVDDAHRPCQWDRQDITGLNLSVDGGDWFAVEAGMAFQEQLLRLAAAFGEPAEVEKFIQPQRRPSCFRTVRAAKGPCGWIVLTGF